jgi:glycosyltransferase involved in cell wall biosynthesis
MLGFEFPPFFAGGVGVVAESLTRELAGLGVEVTYLMPRAPAELSPPHLRLLSAEVPGAAPVALVPVPAELPPYASPTPHNVAARLGHRLGGAAAPGGNPYAGDLLGEVRRFADGAVARVRELGLRFDLIHAHDWTTFPAAAALKAAFGRPALAHVHITEFDKSGGAWADPDVFAIERDGMAAADRVIAVSRYTARACVERYGVAPERIEVVHNAIEPSGGAAAEPEPAPELPAAGPIVLFLGRMTTQKGPGYFLEAARRVHELRPDATFVLAGTGDLLPAMIERAAELGLGERALFTGFVDRAQALALYDRAAVFVMPSVSEPFGIVPLEALDRGVPVIVSRQSGVSEVLRHALKVDFWDVEGLAARITAALSYPTLARELAQRGGREVRARDWGGVARRVRDLYASTLGGDPC